MYVSKQLSPQLIKQPRPFKFNMEKTDHDLQTWPFSVVVGCDLLLPTIF